MSFWYAKKLHQPINRHNVELAIALKTSRTGFDWDPTGKRAAKEMSWDDGFQQLVRLFDKMYLKLIDFD